MTQQSQIFASVSEKLHKGESIPTISKNGIEVPQLTVFEDVILHNQDNLKTRRWRSMGISSLMRSFSLRWSDTWHPLSKWG